MFLFILSAFSAANSYASTNTKRLIYDRERGFTNANEVVEEFIKNNIQSRVNVEEDKVAGLLLDENGNPRPGVRLPHTEPTPAPPANSEASANTVIKPTQTYTRSDYHYSIEFPGSWAEIPKSNSYWKDIEQKALKEGFVYDIGCFNKEYHSSAILDDFEPYIDDFNPYILIHTSKGTQPSEAEMKAAVESVPQDIDLGLDVISSVYSESDHSVTTIINYTEEIIYQKIFVGKDSLVIIDGLYPVDSDENRDEFFQIADSFRYQAGYEYQENLNDGQLFSIKYFLYFLVPFGGVVFAVILFLSKFFKAAPPKPNE
jgi:hypothetical protein